MLAWVLWVLLMVIAIIGLQYVTRGTSVRHVRGVGADGRPVAPGEPDFPLTVAMLTGTVLLAGNRVEVAKNGDETYPRLWDDLRGARDSITIQLYYGHSGALADTFRRILIDRAAQGVHVLMLYDAFGFQYIPLRHREELRKAGIRVEPFRPLRLSTLRLANNRAHIRGIVIDGRIGWTGGFGIDDKWLGDGRTNGSWRETNVRFEGPAVRQLQAAFAAAWAEATGTLLSGRHAAIGADGATTAGLLYATPTNGSTAAERFVAMSIGGATRTLYVTNPYFVPGKNFAELLGEAARRGVDVRVLTAGPRTDVKLVRLAGRAHYQALLDAGVRIFEWSPTTLHAKTFVVDGLWSTIGSMNCDNRSMSLNDESTLMVLDERFGGEMNAMFMDDLSRSEEITLEVFGQRWWGERVLEQAASVFASVM